MPKYTSRIKKLSPEATVLSFKVTTYMYKDLESISIEHGIKFYECVKFLLLEGINRYKKEQYEKVRK